MADRDEDLLLVAEGIRKFIKYGGGYDKVQLVIEKSLAEFLADRIEEWCKHGEKDAANI